MIEKIKLIEDKAIRALDSIKNLKELELFKVEILGKKGELTSVMKSLMNVKAENRPLIGKLVNESKEKILEKLTSVESHLVTEFKRAKLKKERVDISLPGKKVETACEHILTQTMREIRDIFMGMGFEVVDGPEIESVYNNFDALNISKSHPSRSTQDTFYISEDSLLRTQTSGMQIRYMKEVEPPLRMISIGKVYRPDFDVTHTPMFHQIEGLMVGENVSFANLKSILRTFSEKLFSQANVRFRPHYFPFTEPSAEMDIECGICKGKGCRSCKHTGWLEILGCGMVHPNVLKEVGIDPNKYQGFAFGMGVERVAMLKNKISDLRLFFDNDIRFLKQFK
ncbi:MAG: phenylalanine--tRNA ligase subunit alpha [Fusobacteria bacterium]|nr:phenylalanine--tRNA ligase subunit alpha [Fusobacteriota bacterium]